MRHELFAVHGLPKRKEKMPGLQVNTAQKQRLRQMRNSKLP